MSKRKHLDKYSNSHNKSLFNNTPISEYNFEKEVLGKKLLLDKFLNSIVIYENICICGFPLNDTNEHLCLKCRSLKNSSNDSLNKNSKSIFSGWIGSIKKITVRDHQNLPNKAPQIIHNVKFLEKSWNLIQENSSIDRTLHKSTTNTCLPAEDKKLKYGSNIEDWMTSLRTQVNYYQFSDNISNVKSIPSKNNFHFSCCSFSSVSTSVAATSATSMKTSKSLSNFSYCSDTFSNKSEEDLDLAEQYKSQILKFKRNLMDHETSQIKNVKLRANNKKLVKKRGDSSSSSTTPTSQSNDSLQSTLDSNFSRRIGFVGGESSNNRHGIYKKFLDTSDSEFVNDILTVFDSYLKSDSQTHTLDGSSIDDRDDQTTIAVQETVPSSEKNCENFMLLKCNSNHQNIYNNNKIVFRLDLSEICENLCLNVSLNKIVITYDEYLKSFLKNYECKNTNLDLYQLVNIFVKWRRYCDKIRKRKKLISMKAAVEAEMIAAPSPTPMIQSSKTSNSDTKKTQSKLMEEENIYQPIWKFKTAGETEILDTDERYSPVDSSAMYLEEVDEEQEEGDDGEWEPADDISYLTCTEDIIKSKQSTPLPEIVQTSQSHYDFRNETNNNYKNEAEIKFNRKGDIERQYQKVCILYSEVSSDQKYRAIIYDYNPIIFLPSLANTSKVSNLLQIEYQSPKKSNINRIENVKNTFSNNKINYIEVWKRSLYMEDEEDMYISDNEITSLNEQTGVPVPISYSQTNIPVLENTLSLQRYKSISSGNLLDVTPNEKKTITENLRDKLQRGLFKFNVKPREIKGRKNKQASSLYLEETLLPIFGANLESLEKHFTFKNVPKFLVDAIDIIERIDNIEVDGLYRISGNKVDVDSLKKHLMTSRYDKSCLYTEDINTLTSLIKLFFRELSTPLIPDEYYERLPSNLLLPESIPEIRDILNRIPDLPKDTLKFLVKHLKIVSKHSSMNRMPASNLAIVWGPCIMAPNNLGPLDIARMNTLAKVMIESFDDIFKDNERYI